MTKVFNNTGDDFSALYEAQDWCKENGYSVGAMQRDEPIGLAKGDWDIAKWRNLSELDRASLDGTITFPTGSPRTGPAVVTIPIAIIGAK